MTRPALSPERAADRALLRAAIDRSGLSVKDYAEAVLLRGERTVKRWLAGDVAISPHVLAYLKSQHIIKPTEDTTP